MLVLVIQFSLALGQYVLLSTSPALNKFKSYCQPAHQPLPTNGLRYTKVIAVFRHGDRTPLAAGNSMWKNQKCLDYRNGKTVLVPCKEGLLTAKGYEQAKLLGAFIRDNYKTKIAGTYKGIRTGHTEILRTATTLDGVLNGLGMPQTTFVLERGLLSEPGCVSLRSRIQLIKDLARDYPRFDRYMASICNDVPVNCGPAGCAISEIEKVISKEQRSYVSLMASTKSDLSTNAVSFSGLARLLAEAMQGPESIVLLSAHDSTISKLLAGLLAKDEEIPPYTSAVFIEFLVNNQGTELVRVNYNGKAMKIGLDQLEMTPKTRFEYYLNAFSSNKEKVEELCRNFKHDQKKNEAEYRREIKKRFNPEFVKQYEALSWNNLGKEISAVTSTALSFIIDSTNHLLQGLKKAMLSHGQIGSGLATDKSWKLLSGQNSSFMVAPKKDKKKAKEKTKRVELTDENPYKNFPSIQYLNLKYFPETNGCDTCAVKVAMDLSNANEPCKCKQASSCSENKCNTGKCKCGNACKCAAGSVKSKDSCAQPCEMAENAESCKTSQSCEQGTEESLCEGKKNTSLCKKKAKALAPCENEQDNSVCAKKTKCSEFGEMLESASNNTCSHCRPACNSGIPQPIGVLKIASKAPSCKCKC